MKFDSIHAGERFFAQTFYHTARIVAGVHQVWRPHPDAMEYQRSYMGTWVIPYDGRSWFTREHLKHRLHPVIEHVICKLNYRPLDWHQLLLEWPHRSETDHNRLAYTQDERKGERDIQTVTSIGKYLQRHFVMPDHEIRDAAALFTDAGTMEIRHTMQDIIDAAIHGPTSCMSKRMSINCDDGVSRHPYEVYNPELGWSVAVRINGKQIDGRALVYKDDTHHYFVRSYKRDLNGGYSHSDERLESWLIDQGIKKLSGWGGARIAAYSVRGGYLAPYLDGDDDYVFYDSDQECLIIADCDGGEYHAQETTGMTADASGETCEDCGETCDEDDMYWVGLHEDRRVCHHCIECYTWVYGRRGSQYYMHDDDVVHATDGESYDRDYLSDNNIVELSCGDYSHIDSAVYIESDNSYYDINSDDICYAEDTERYELRNDCWMCSESGNYYTDDTDYELIDGEKVHPDYAPETDDEDEEDDDEVVAEVEVVNMAAPNEWCDAPALTAEQQKELFEYKTADVQATQRALDAHFQAVTSQVSMYALINNETN